MKRTGNRNICIRQLTLQLLEKRDLLATIVAQLSIEEPIGPVYSYESGGHTFVTTVYNQGAQPRLETALVSDSGLSPASVDQVLSLPEGTESAEIFFLLDNNSAIGKVSSEAEPSRTVLWIEPHRYLVLANERVVTLAALENQDGFFIALLGDNFVPVIVHVDQNGQKETVELTIRERIIGAGFIDDVATFVGAALTDQGEKPAYFQMQHPLQVTEHLLTAPEDTFISELVGIGQKDGKPVFVGNITTTAGQQVIGIWANDGSYIETIRNEIGLRAVSVTGSIVLADDFGVAKLIPLDTVASSYIGAPALTPVALQYLAPIAGQYDAFLINGLHHSGDNFFGSFIAIKQDAGELYQIMIGGNSRLSFNGFHNYKRPVDVNNDGLVSPIDALLVINELNQKGSGVLSYDDSVRLAGRFVDVNKDEFVSPLDALLVINFLNARNSGGEGEQSETIFVMQNSAVFLDIYDIYERKRAALLTKGSAK